MGETFQRRISALLLSNRRHARYVAAVACMAVLVALGVTVGLTQKGQAKTHEETVLDCQYSGSGAHTHDASCYDADGNLVCPLEEREYHVHDDSCYASETYLVCGLEEGAGAHAHDESCYDEEGNLVCGLEESAGHVHDDSCWQTDTYLVCGKDEVSESHTHGEGCFKTIVIVDEEPEPEPAATEAEPAAEAGAETEAETEAPAKAATASEPAKASVAESGEQTFAGELKDADGNVVLAVSVKAPEGALPEGATMRVKPIEAVEVAAKVNEAVQAEAGEGKVAKSIMAVDIAFLDGDGNEVEPSEKVEVRITTALVRDVDAPALVHIDEKKDTAEVVKDTAKVNADEKDTTTGHEDTLKFDTDKFSPFAVVEVGDVEVEETTEPVVAMPAQSFEGSTDDVVVTVEAAEGAFPEGTTMTVSAIAADEVMDQVEAAVQSQAEEGTAVRVKQALAVDIKFYDADGNEVEPLVPVTVRMAAQAVRDIAEPVLVHVDQQAEEAQILSDVTMVNSHNEAFVGDEDTLKFEADKFSPYVIVELETITADYLTADGKTYKITVTFDERETVTDDMSLNVNEIAEGTEAYNVYLQKTADEMWLNSTDEIADARFFDIEIIKDGKKYEPEYPAQVTIQYDDAIQVAEDQQLSVVHFADEGTELISDVQLSEDGSQVVYEQGSFSVAGTILANNSSNSRASSMMLIVNDGSRYFAVDKDLVLHEIDASKFRTSGNTTVEFLEGDFVFDNEHGAGNVGQLAPYLWGRDISTNNNHIQEYHNADGEYLQFYPNNGQYVEGYYPNGNVFVSKDVNTSANNTAIILSGNTIYQKVNNPGTWPGSSYTNTSKDFFLKINYSDDGTPTLASFTDGSSSDRANVYFVKPTVVAGESGSEGGGGTPGDELGEPTTNKNLTSNHDGTYTLSLSVTGASKGSTEAAPGDVLLVMDISNSMKNSDMQAAKEAAITFSGALLGDPENELKLALETYSKTVTFPGVLDGFTSDQAYFESMVNTITADGAGETNWDSALSQANSFFTNHGTASTAPKYVVFLTDGKPNAYGSSGTVESYNYPTESSKAYPPAEANALTLKASGAKIFIVAVESSESTQLEYNAMHQHVKKLAYALFNDEDAYYTADESTLINILAEIAAEINKEYSYKKVTIEDSVTGGSMGTAVNGDVSNFTYTITTKDGTKKEYEDFAHLQADYPGIENPASYESGTDTVTWNLGNNYQLEDGTTYTVNFVVWPNQKTYDAIADIKNGVKTYGQVIAENPELADTLTETGEYLTNKSEEVDGKQVSSAKVVYDSVVNVTVGETTTTETVVEGGVTRMENPDPEPLTSSEVNIKKKWEGQLPGQDAPTSIDLELDRDGSPYLYVGNHPITVTSPYYEGKAYVAPGILLTEEQVVAKGMHTADLKAVTYKTSETDTGTTYYLINSGHNYQFNDNAQGFEIEEKIFHPVLINGALVDVTVSGTAQAPVYTKNSDIDSDHPYEITNIRRGGINISKTVEADGVPVTDDDTPFTLTVTLKAPMRDGQYNWRSVEKYQNKYVAWYRYYTEGKEPSEVTDNELDFINDGQRNHSYGDNWFWIEFDSSTGQASGDLVIPNGWKIRFTNIAADTTYNVIEDVPAGYEESHVYKHKAWNEEIEDWVETEDEGQESPSFFGTVYSDQENNVEVTNTMLTSDMKLIKCDDEFNAITNAEDTAVFVLTKNTQVDGKGQWEAATGEGIGADGTVTVNNANGISLVGMKNGLYKMVETKAPNGYIVMADPLYFKLQNGQITFVSVVGSGEDTVVTPIDTPANCEVVEKTQTTPVALKISNTAGTELPHTGGMGTTLFSIFGSALMASAVVYGFASRRRREGRLD